LKSKKIQRSANEAVSNVRKQGKKKQRRKKCRSRVPAIGQKTRHTGCLANNCVLLAKISTSSENPGGDEQDNEREGGKKVATENHKKRGNTPWKGKIGGLSVSREHKKGDTPTHKDTPGESEKYGTK